MSFDMRRIILTGATGFIGSHALSPLEARGFEIHALGRRRPASTVAFHQVDLLDDDTVRSVVQSIGASHLLHLAWYAEPGHYWRSPANLDWVAASLRLTRIFCEAGGIRAVTAGTCAEYAWGPERLHESAVCSPGTLYGAAKDGLQRILTAYAKESAMSFATGRIFFLYGPGERPGRLVGDAIQALVAGVRFGATLGLQRRDFSHVADVADAFAALVDSEVTGPVNIGSGTAVPVIEVLGRIGGLTGRPQLIDYGARRSAHDEPASIEADIERLSREVGFRARYDLDSGLAHTVEAFARS